MTRKHRKMWLLLANVLLFLSSCILLIDLAPVEFSRAYKVRAAAVETLRGSHNVLDELPAGIKVRPESLDLRLTSDSRNFVVLRDLMREKSSLAGTVDWAKTVGIGYSTIRLPVGQLSLDAFHPVYAVVMPAPENSTFSLVPLGELSQLDSWLTEWKQSSLTTAALVCLSLGFLLQLIDALQEWRAAG
jgi:hypothetical protein